MRALVSPGQLSAITEEQVQAKKNLALNALADGDLNLFGETLTWLQSSDANSKNTLLNAVESFQGRIISRIVGLGIKAEFIADYELLRADINAKELEGDFIAACDKLEKDLFLRIKEEIEQSYYYCAESLSNFITVISSLKTIVEKKSNEVPKLTDAAF